MNNKFFKNDTISKELSTIRQTAATNWKRQNGIEETLPLCDSKKENSFDSYSMEPLTLNELTTQLNENKKDNSDNDLQKALAESEEMFHENESKLLSHLELQTENQNLKQEIITLKTEIASLYEFISTLSN